MPAATQGTRDQLIDIMDSELDKIFCIGEVILSININISGIISNIHSRAIPNSQQAQEFRMLHLYRDDAPGAYIPCENGVVPTLVELELPRLCRRDLKLLIRYPEPHRTALWIRMSFVADGDYIASSGVLCKAYADALQPLVDKLDRGVARTAPATPLLYPDEFAALLEKEIAGCEEFSWNRKKGKESRTITRGVRARADALAFASTNRKHDLRRLKYYKKKGDLVYPKGDPDKRSTFAKWLAQDPLFMLPSETQSPLVTRMIANSARSEGGIYYDGKGTEDAGFPGVSIEKSSKKGKERKQGKSTRPNPTPGGATRSAAAAGQTDAEYLASLEADWAAVGGFGTLDSNAKEQGDTQGEASAPAKGKEREDGRDDKWWLDPRLQPLRAGPLFAEAQHLASLRADWAAAGGSGTTDGNAKERGDTQREAACDELQAKAYNLLLANQERIKKMLDAKQSAREPSADEASAKEESAEKASANEASANEASANAPCVRDERIDKLLKDKKAALDRIASLRRELDQEKAQTPTEDRNANVPVQRTAADSAEDPSSAQSALLNNGLFQSPGLEPDVTVAFEKKKPEAGAGCVRKRPE
jgi:hypothetical protein